MQVEKRHEARYKILGYAKCDAISPMSGGLVDLSLHGCKIFYNLPVAINFENEFDLFLQISDGQSLDLICRPVWMNEDSGKTIVGFEILHSPDSEKLRKYISILDERRKNENFENQIMDAQCQFL